MGTIYMVFGSVAIVISGILLSRNTLKRAKRKRKTHAVLSLLRQASDK